jgi:hypothetical protein
MRKNYEQKTPEQLVAELSPFVGKTFAEVVNETGVRFPERLAGKGVVGHFVEDLVGLPKDSDRLDYGWGDLKTDTYHQGCKLGGCIVGSLNSLASEMLVDDVDFDEFVLGRKIGQTVLVTVCTNRRGGGKAGDGWERFTFESVSSHALNQLPQWQGVKEDWEFLKNYVHNCVVKDDYVSSSKKGLNGYLTFNSCGGEFKFQGRNLRRPTNKSKGVQLALGATLVREVCG